MSLKNNIIETLMSGPQSAASIASRLRVNASSITRALNGMGDNVLKAGNGPATRWFLRRYLPMATDLNSMPNFRVNVNGKAEKIALLHVVYPQNCYLVEYFRKGVSDAKVKPECTFYESLPWWLSDMRPQGFLGRSFAKQLRQRNILVDADPNRWDEDTVLAVLVSFPQDHIGNLIIGEAAYSNWLHAAPEPTLSDIEAAGRAEAIARGEHFDSSVKGEQPKFSAKLLEGECLVKFSGRAESLEVDSVAIRWSDLLHAEAIASHALNHMMPDIAAVNRSFSLNKRTFLVSKRFDRNEQGGRLGLVSFTSLDLEFVGKANEPWPLVAEALLQEGVITERAMVRTKVAWAFGQLIANADMHLGNISAENTGGRPYELSPIYDMLPMHFSPTSNGDLPNSVYVIRNHPSVNKLHWEMALHAAKQFWEQVLSHPGISAVFKEIALKQMAVVDAFNYGNT